MKRKSVKRRFFLLVTRAPATRTLATPPTILDPREKVAGGRGGGRAAVVTVAVEGIGKRELRANGRRRQSFESVGGRRGESVMNGNVVDVNEQAGALIVLRGKARNLDIENDRNDPEKSITRHETKEPQRLSQIIMITIIQ